MSDDIPSDPPADETERAIWTIRRMVKSVTGKALSDQEARALFNTARERMKTAMADVTPGANQ